MKGVEGSRERQFSEVDPETEDVEMRTKGRRVATVATMSMLVVVLIASPAFALVEKNGGGSCQYGYVNMHSYGYGQVNHYAPAGSFVQGWMNTTYKTRSSVTFHQATPWKVTATIGLESPGTYSNCWGG